MRGVGLLEVRHRRMMHRSWCVLKTRLTVLGMSYVVEHGKMCTTTLARGQRHELPHLRHPDGARLTRHPLIPDTQCMFRDG
jgi:hypothetical protein